MKRWCLFGEEEVVSCSYQGTEHFPPSHPMPSSPLPHPSPFQILIPLIFLSLFPSSFYPLAQTVSAEVNKVVLYLGLQNSSLYPTPSNSHPSIISCSLFESLSFFAFSSCTDSLIRQHCRLTICIELVELTNSIR